MIAVLPLIASLLLVPPVVAPSAGQTPVLQAPVSGPSGEVQIHGQAYEIPALPRTLEEARRDFPRIRVRTDEALRELEKDLQSTYRAAGLEAFPLASRMVVVEPSQAPEAQYLATFIRDSEHLMLESDLFERWSEWQVHLVGLGMNHEDTQAGWAISTGLRCFPPSYADHGKTAQGGKIQIYAAGQDLERLPMEELRFEGLFGGGFYAVEGVDYRGTSRVTREAAQMAEARVRLLADPWEKLTSRIAARADEYLRHEYDHPEIRDPGIKCLRLKARIQVLERTRYAYWFCQLIWAHMASKSLPVLYQAFPGVY